MKATKQAITKRPRGTNRLPAAIPAESLRDAIADLESGVKHAFAESTKYDVICNGKRFPPKAVVGIAAKRVTGKDYVPYDFTGGIGSKCFRLLIDAGFDIVPKVGEIEDENEAEAESEKIHFEGDVSVRTVRQYERSRKAREQCIRGKGVICAVCQFSFEQEYGEIGRGFIHVHHLEMVSDRKGTRAVVPDRDLAPVCANCHAMLHRKRPPYTIEELKETMDHARRRRGENNV
jgi:5-methylcytosine-specific restriction protein A